MVNKVRSMAGKKGAEIKHKTRYEILKELSGLYDKKNLNWFMTEWRTRHLVELIKWVRKAK